MERKLLDMTSQLFISEYNPRMEYCDKFKFRGMIYEKNDDYNNRYYCVFSK